MDLTFTTVALLVILSTVAAQKKPAAAEATCPSGVVGPVCSKRDPCKPGYSCINKRCCRDPVCPAGSIEGGSCNKIAGQPKCDRGFDCIKDFCCKQKVAAAATTCSSGVTGPVCSAKAPCKAGFTCTAGRCCRDQGCPKGMVAGGQCKRMMVAQPRCEPGYQCINDNCCKARPVKAALKTSRTTCPKSQTASGACGVGKKCARGATCVNDVCCRQAAKP